MVVVAAAVGGVRRRRRKRGRTSGGTRVRRRGDWEGGEKVMVNTVREWSMVALVEIGAKKQSGGKGE